MDIFQQNDDDHNYGADIRLDQKLYHTSSSSDEDQNKPVERRKKKRNKAKSAYNSYEMRQGMYEMRDQLERLQHQRSNAIKSLGRRMSKMEEIIKQMKRNN